MNKHSKKLISFGLCTALCAGGVGSTVYALNRNDTVANQSDALVNTATNHTSSEAAEASKDETVYVLAGADGSVNKIIVSDWIQNSLSSNDISDKSELTGIENVKGDESYSLNADNMTVWDAKGNDIYYQGTIEKELPVNLSVSYTLDGKAISAEELAGKSGKVTIRFDYENKQYEMAEIDGQQEKIYVPFAMITGMLLDNDTFRNVEVSGGKLINDGDRTAVMGIAFPGLQENLALDEELFQIPDYVEITADAVDFEFGMTVTFATNEIFNNIDTGKLSSSDSLSGSLGELTTAMSQLMDGSSALYTGLSTLLDKSGELVSGINQLAEGAEALAAGAEALDNGAAALKNGTTELYNGLSTISSNNDTLNAGAKQVFDTLLATATSQLTAAGLNVPALTISNYADTLTKLVSSLDKTSAYNQALQMVTATVEENRSLIETKVTAAVRQQVAELVVSTATSGKMNLETYTAAVSAGQLDEATQGAIEAAITEQMKTADVQDKIAEAVEAQIELAISDAMASDEVQQKLNSASEAVASITALKTSLDSYNTFYTGLAAYTDGVATAAKGASELNTGAAELKDGSAQLKLGASQLFDGVLQLKDGAPALIDGITQLADGSMQLSDGLKQFNEEGIEKLVDALGENLAETMTRINATFDVSKNYTNFSGISDEMDGQIKFIYRTDSIEACSTARKT